MCGIPLHFHKMYNTPRGLSVLTQSQMHMCAHSEILPTNIASRYFQVSTLELFFAPLTNTVFIKILPDK